VTQEEYLEYWNSMSRDELIVRCGLYIARINELEKQAKEWQAITDESMMVDCKTGKTNIKISANGRNVGVHVQVSVGGNIVNNFRQELYLPNDVWFCRKTQT
jgi:hypothetical protein